MKKTKILLGALSLTAIAPMMPIALTSCGTGSTTDNSFSPKVEKDANVKEYTVSKTELNKAFSVICTCADGYQLDSTKTTVKVGDKTLALDTDYIVYKDTVIVASGAVTNKNVNVNLVSRVNDSVNVTITTDAGVTKTTHTATMLNTAFSVICTLADNYEIDRAKTSIKIGDKTLTLDTDYIVHDNILIVASSAVINKNIAINIATSPVITHFTVSLYANNGTFDGTSTSLIINEVPKGTALKDVSGYKVPSSADGDFAYWLDANGNKYTADSKITSNVMLGAYYEEKAKEPVNLQTDNWATVGAACESAVTFTKAYLDQAFVGPEADAITYIKGEIDKFAKKTDGYKDLTKQMKINLGGRYVNVTIRLIDVGQDKAFDETNTKTLFTWEFKDIIDICSYNIEANSTWYQENAETGEVLYSCLLRENCNKILFKEVLPLSVQKKIVSVAKETRTESGGAVVKSKEEVFPLSYGEIGLQAANTVINDLKGQGQYQFYYSQVGKANKDVATKFYLGYDGTKEYSEEYKPIIKYQMWCRSPNNNVTIWKYNPDDQTLKSLHSNNGLGVAPAFCL